MPLRLLQIREADCERAVVALQDDGKAFRVNGVDTTRALALAAIGAGLSLAEAVEKRGLGEAIDVRAEQAEGRVLAPVDHPDPAHLYVTGTGLTHLGSAEGRDKMHRDLADAETLTDSMRMFKLGLEGGKPAADECGVQPEWFYKGDGSILAGPGQNLLSPAFALDGGEEPEIVGVYVIGPNGAPYRIGFALGNEFSDHVTEKQNYLYLAHSKLRRCSLGPELLTGALPDDIRGASRIKRGNAIVWEKPFLSGEAHMCHHIRNLEHHHFKYDLFRRPGDVHVHFFGTATLSFSDGFRAEPGDEFEIEAAPFLLPLRNKLEVAPSEPPIVVRQL